MVEILGNEKEIPGIHRAADYQFGNFNVIVNYLCEFTWRDVYRQRLAGKGSDSGQHQ